jgi:hypothetical protein
VKALLDSYLVGVIFWLNLALGGLGAAAIHGLTGGRWGAAARPGFGWLVRSFVVLLVAMLPLALAYRSVLPVTVATSLPPAQARYFAAPWLLARLALYFAIWIGLGAWLARVRGERRTAVAAGAAVLYVLTATLFAVDWLASSRPASIDTIIGFVLVGGQLTAALAFAILLLALRSTAVPRGVAADRRQDLGNLLLSAAVFYAYALVMQLLIIWSADLPREADWYIARGSTLGVTAAMGLALTHSAAIGLLCSRRVKRSRSALAATAVLVLAGHLFATYWWLAPLLDASPLRVLDVVTIAVLGYVCAFVSSPRRPARFGSSHRSFRGRAPDARGPLAHGRGP